MIHLSLRFFNIFKKNIPKILFINISSIKQARKKLESRLIPFVLVLTYSYRIYIHTESAWVSGGSPIGPIIDELVLKHSTLFFFFFLSFYFFPLCRDMLQRWKNQPRRRCKSCSVFLPFLPVRCTRSCVDLRPLSSWWPRPSLDLGRYDRPAKRSAVDRYLLSASPMLSPFAYSAGHCSKQCEIVNVIS